MSLKPPRRIFVSTTRRTGQGAGLWRRATVVVVVLSVVGGRVFLAEGETSAALVLKPHENAAAILGDAGAVAVVDGNTLRLGGKVVQLAGVSMDGRDSGCGGQAHCATAAIERLAALVRNRSVACRVESTQLAGPAKAVCEADGVELNAVVSGSAGHGL